jgi:flavin-dependent dehydrogenase
VSNGPRDVAIVGGGPAGSALAIRLARAGRDVVLFERTPEPAWRACGVFASPVAVARLRSLGLPPDTIEAVIRQIPAMRVETRPGTSFRLTYGDDGSLRAPAVGFDRPTLDRVLLSAAEGAGANVRRGTLVTAVEPAADEGRLRVRGPAGEETVTARVMVGADGIRSLVARTARVLARPRLGMRVGLTFHVADGAPDVTRDARMVVLDGAYCGLAPVPDGRVNVGIVLASIAWRRRLARHGAASVAGQILSLIPAAANDPTPWAAPRRCDPIVGAAPLAHRVVRRAGSGWLLVGDAAGFLDPFTGEGLHRAFVSAELAADTIGRHLAMGSGLGAYDRAMRRRFGGKDIATYLVQAFLAAPPVFDYASRRLALRADVRETMGRVIGDLLPASRALDPRFLVALLRP